MLIGWMGSEQDLQKIDGESGAFHPIDSAQILFRPLLLR